jgi:mRNA-degrading endonuclease YafQ of YafQ-DinJ toxin-antitoxin module
MNQKYDIALFYNHLGLFPIRRSLYNQFLNIAKDLSKFRNHNLVQSWKDLRTRHRYANSCQIHELSSPNADLNMSRDVEKLYVEE